jgi:hypothetical protein
VPSATNAASATNADNATNAQHAQTADAIPAPEALHLIGEPGAPFAPTWGNIGGLHAGFYKDREGVVHLEGTVKGNGSSSRVFTLPPGYRPATTGVFPAAGSNDTYARVSINESGDVFSSNQSFVNLYGVTFRAES